MGIRGKRAPGELLRGPQGVYLPLGQCMESGNTDLIQTDGRLI